MEEWQRNLEIMVVLKSARMQQLQESKDYWSRIIGQQENTTSPCVYRLQLILRSFMSTTSSMYDNASEEIRNESSNGNCMELVNDLTSKVQTLQNAYEEYLDAEQVSEMKQMKDRMLLDR